jgi:hypothetical protein
MDRRIVVLFMVFGVLWIQNGQLDAVLAIDVYGMCCRFANPVEKRGMGGII